MRPTRSSLRRAAAIAVAGTLVTGSLLGAPAQAAPASPASPDAAASPRRQARRPRRRHVRRRQRQDGRHGDRRRGRPPGPRRRRHPEARHPGRQPAQGRHRRAGAVRQDPGHRLVDRPGHQPGRRLRRQHRHRRQAGAGQGRRRPYRWRGPDRGRGRRAEHPHLRRPSHLRRWRRRCSLGFNVRSGSASTTSSPPGTAPTSRSNWYSNSGQTSLLGTRAGTSFPGNDYGIVRHSNSANARPSNVYLYNGSYQNITSAGNAYVGQSVQRSGSTTGLRSGSVTAINATVNYAEGSVSGLIRTNVCAEPGDSGGSLFSRQHRARHHLRRQRQLLQRRHHLLPAGHRGAERLRREHLLIDPTRAGRRAPAARFPRFRTGPAAAKGAAACRGPRPVGGADRMRGSRRVPQMRSSDWWLLPF